MTDEHEDQDQTDEIDRQFADRLLAQGARRPPPGSGQWHTGMTHPDTFPARDKGKDDS
jgi:hypothetical protein